MPLVPTTGNAGRAMTLLISDAVPASINSPNLSSTVGVEFVAVVSGLCDVGDANADTAVPAFTGVRTGGISLSPTVAGMITARSGWRA